jgi:predicted DsbA family dithiol-disulfide isomerase
VAKKLRVEVWSDIACPWCFLGRRRLQAALARFEHRDDVEVLWRAFELDPSAPPERDPTVSHAERLAKKYGISVARAQERTAHLTALGRAEGIAFDFERIRSGNTFDAHRVVHLGRQRGIQETVQDRLMRAYFSEGEPIGERDALVRLGGEAGLDSEEIGAMLASDALAAEVRADEAQAREYGIDGVPFFVLGGRYAVAGAQPPERMLEALTRAWGAQR